MNNKKKKQNGFTIVELVIVIAVIGILAAVLIPTFSNLVKKAKQSADQQLVYHINEAVVANETDNIAKGKNATEATMYDTLKKLESDYGFTVEKMTPRSGNDIVWDSTTNRFALVAKNGTVIYTDSNRPTLDMTNKAQMWRITEAGESLTDGYAHYLTTGWSGPVEVETGVDVGDNDDITKVTYDSSSDASAVVRTNGGTLTVIAPNGTVNHYGEADKVDVQSVAGESYHENGVVKLIAVKKGHVELEGKAEVNGIYVYNNSQGETKDTSFAEIKITVKAGVDVPKFSRSAVKIADEGTKVCTVVTDQAKDIYLFNEGIYEQMKVADAGAAKSTAKWVDTDASASANTQTAAMQLANEFNGTYENGKIADKAVEVTEGTNAGSYTVKFNEETRTFETYKVEDNTETKVTAEAVVKDVAKVADVASDSGKTEEEAAKASALKGTGTEADPFLIYDYETMQMISEFYDKGYYYFAVDLSKTNNGTIDCTNWVSVDLYGSFNGNGVKLINLDNTLFRYVDGFGNNDETSIKNFDIYQCRIVKTGSNAAVVVYGNTNLTIENVDVSGYIEGQGQVGTYIFYPGSGVLTFKDCVAKTTNVAIGSPAAGFIVNPYCMLPNFGGTAESKIVLDNSYFEGKLKTTKTAKYKNVGDTSWNPATACGSYVYAHNVNINVEFVNESTEKASLHVTQTREGYNFTCWYIADRTYYIPAVSYSNAITNPNASFGSTLIINRYNDSIVKATVSLFISPNAANNESGSYTGTYYTETINVTDSTFETSNVKKLNVAINGSIDGYTLNQVSTETTDVVNNTLNIVRSGYGHTHNGVTIYIVQYDADNEAVAYTSWTYIEATTGKGNYKASISYTRNGQSYTASYLGSTLESVQAIATYISENYPTGYDAEGITIVYQQKNGNNWNNIA